MESKKQLRRLVSVIIPAHNEERYIGKTLESLNNFLPKEIIVVDDGSIDETAAIARRRGVCVLTNKTRQGKAQAVAKGVAAAGEDVILLVDADLGETAGYTVKLFDILKRYNLDMVVGVLPEKKGGFGILRGLAHWGILLLAKKRLKQPLSGQRAFRKKIFQNCLAPCRGFGLEIALSLDTLRAGYEIEEFELPLKHRHTEKNMRGFLHRGRQTIDILHAFGTRLFL